MKEKSQLKITTRHYKLWPKESMAKEVAKTFDHSLDMSIWKVEIETVRQKDFTTTTSCIIHLTLLRSSYGVSAK